MTPYKTIRKQNGWTQKKLSEYLNIPLKLIKKYEQPCIQPPLSYRRRFMIVFNADWNELSTDHNDDIKINHKQNHKGDHKNDEKRKNEAIDNGKPEN
mgnify:CR=1 FL=1